jgi:hypothetical protein
MRSTVARRLSMLCSFYRYCHLEGFLARNPAANVHRPKVDAESRTLGLDRNGLAALPVQAGPGSPRDHALISLLAINGLRISETLGADIDDLDVDRGHRTLRVVRKGGKQSLSRSRPRTARALDLYIGERVTGPIFLGAAGTLLPERSRSASALDCWRSGRRSEAPTCSSVANVATTTGEAAIRSRRERAQLGASTEVDDVDNVEEPESADEPEPRSATSPSRPSWPRPTATRHVRVTREWTSAPPCWRLSRTR